MYKKIITSITLFLMMLLVMPQHAEAALRHKAVSADAAQTGTSFGFLDGTDGLQWHFTQENVADGYNYQSSVVTVYNADRVKQGSFTVTVPEGMRVNQIEPYGQITSKLFDTSAATKEVLVYLHEVGNADNNYKGTDHLYVYSLNGEKVCEFIGDGMIVDASPNEWTTWQRLIISRDNEDGINTDIEIYRTPSWGDTGAVLDKTIQVEKNTISYTDGAFVNFFNVEGNPYFVICHYEQPFVEYDEDGNQIMNEETWMPYFTENNYFVVDTYDKSYNLVSSFKVPSNAPSEDYIVRMNAFGTFSNADLSRGKFSGDDKLNYIIMNEDVTMTTEYVTSFDVYDQNGNLLKHLAENVGDNYRKMTDVKGAEEQWMFISSDGASLFAVDLPSCTRTEIPAQVDDYSISFNIDRVPANNAEGYQYIMGVNEAKTDETGVNVIAMFAYLNPDFTSHHYVDINMGPMAQTFTPLVSVEGLDPYLFNTDDQREFLFFSKVRDNEEGTNAHNVLFIANEEGRILETFNMNMDENKGDIWTAMILNYEKRPTLFVNYYNWDEDVNTMEFFDLPLTSFAKGGDGTAANPYLISSAGDLAQIAKHPGANYRVANDFDAHNYAVTVEEFAGTLDGAGHTITNLCVTSDNYYGGLFGTVTGATVKDLTLVNPNAELTQSNQQFGLLGGYCVESKFCNIHVQNASITSQHRVATPVGVIAGMAAAETVVSDCYVSGSEVDVVNNTVGGVVGELRTSSKVERCAVDASTLSAGMELGGIAGIIGNGCSVNDCAVSATLTASNFMGGIAGRCGVSASRGNIERCVFNGVLDCPAMTDANVSAMAVGGIVGYIEPDWQKDKVGKVSANVVYDARIASSNNHYYWPEELRIAGQTIHDEEPARIEEGLANNYQVQGDLDGGVAPTFTDPTSVYGALLNHNEADKVDFWSGLGYAFGNNASAPWVFAESSRPHLYFESNGGSTAILTVTGKPNTVSGIFTIDGKRQNAVRRPGLYIIDGKKRLQR